MQQPFTTEPTWEERMAAAWEAGRAARRNGLPLDRCPHRPGTPAEEEWTTGWHDASPAADEAAKLVAGSISRVVARSDEAWPSNPR